MANRLSTQGAIFLESHEGLVLRAYRDPVGIMTIGIGFTSRSAMFAKFWKNKTGSSKIKRGQKITRKDAMMLLPKMADEEYGAAVNRRMGTLKQHEYDAATSTTYNCGERCLKWKWALALKRGDIAGAARLLRVTAVTAQGKRLPGLVRRRQEESHLLEFAEYGNLGVADQNSDQIREYQGFLKTLGFDPGPIDGKLGPKTRRAVAAFQRTHPQLDIDGVAGTATIAALRRAMAARKAPAKATAGAAASGGGATVTVQQSDLPWDSFAMIGGAVAVVAIVAFYVWRYRDEIEHKFNEVF